MHLNYSTFSHSSLDTSNEGILGVLDIGGTKKNTDALSVLFHFI